ncbi:hypothetical protein IU449_01900 [Nocardia higoensis]|uniref:Excreted virulence factor EspC (Type VII ESX diderm) n=1 Tax=Nocardia higoensis TaxID=228599 RepID=A0ABS0D4A0_9NOCA|nr:hypothetical protein [Nocardia higoensis]MBF6353311.1 hypothetical protein [Nocardia higoensis]
MTTPSKTVEELKRLAGEAESGRLVIELGAAERCAKYCDDYVSRLRILQRNSQEVMKVDSFGNLTSATTLGTKFQSLADGGEGSGSFTDAVVQHIAVIEAMADMYRKAGAAYQACDEATRQAIQQQTNELA